MLFGELLDHPEKVMSDMQRDYATWLFKMTCTLRFS